MGRIKVTAEAKQEGESTKLRKVSLLFREAGPPGSMMLGLSFFERKSRAAVFMRPAALGGLS